MDSNDIVNLTSSSSAHGSGPSSEHLARAADRLLDLGRPASDFAILKAIATCELPAERLQRLKRYAEKVADIDTALSAARELLDRLESAAEQSPAVKRECLALRGSDLFALELLSNLPVVPTLPVEPIPGTLLYLLHHSRPYMSNGYATRGHGMARGMIEAGIGLTCLTRPGFPLDIQGEWPENVPERDVLDGVTYLRELTPKRNGPDRSRTYLSDAADAIEVRLRALRPQAVMVASNYVAALPALIAARRVGLPIAYEVRGFWEITELSRDGSLENAFSHKLKIRIESAVAGACDHIFTLSHPMAEELVARGVSRKRISLLPNSCDPTQLKPRARDAQLASRWNIPEGVPVIGYVGSFVQYEGLDDLVLACAKLRAQGLDFRLVLVGNEKSQGSGRGPIVEQIEIIARDQNLAGLLVMPGRVPHEEVEAWYSLIDIAPFPRKPQPVTEMVTPLKPLEAMVMQKAVVVSSVGAMAEMVEDGKTGLIFAKGDVASLADCLAQLVRDAGLRQRLGQAAQAYVGSERTWLTMGQRVLQWMEGLPGRAGK